MKFVDYIVFSNISNSIKHGNGKNGNWGCGSFVIVILVCLMFVGVVKCGHIDNHEDKNNLERDSLLTYDEYNAINSYESIDTMAFTSKVMYDIPVMNSRFNAKTIDEAQSEGYENGYDDGEEDGMNNDDGDSFDDSCPYSGRMAKAYKEAYQEGYEEGQEDGLDTYMEERDPGEDEEDW